ncbi:hypothetical protein B0H13DRAFT_2404852, partial [Mycena leptocephala]
LPSGFTPDPPVGVVLVAVWVHCCGVLHIRASKSPSMRRAISHPTQSADITGPVRASAARNQVAVVDIRCRMVHLPNKTDGDGAMRENNEEKEGEEDRQGRSNRNALNGMGSPLQFTPAPVISMMSCYFRRKNCGGEGGGYFKDSWGDTIFTARLYHLDYSLTCSRTTGIGVWVPSWRVRPTPAICMVPSVLDGHVPETVQLPRGEGNRFHIWRENTAKPLVSLRLSSSKENIRPVEWALPEIDGLSRVKLEYTITDQPRT